MKTIAIVLLSGWIVALSGCGLEEIQNRSATLEKLLATNAPLSAVEQVIGDVPIYRPGTPGWNQLRGTYAQHPKEWYHRHLLEQIDNAATFGWTSSMTMQTWIFLDKEDRLIGFEVGAQ